MTYQETIDYLFTRLPMFSRIGSAAYKKDLTNTIHLCDFLGNPQEEFKSIHVAGTNGKGSVSHMVAAVLQQAGYKTGLYTSPHLKDFRERIKVNGGLVPEDFVVRFTERIKRISEEIEPSFFELTVAMAFEYFKEEKVDVAVIETGLGGRLDSTNIIYPEISVITNIGWDHMNMLGDTLEKIAFEKAGIIKPGVPVVIGEGIQETMAVFTKVAASMDAPLTVASEKRKATDWNWEKHLLSVETSEIHHTDRHVYQLDLTGIYQLKNILTVLESIAQLQTKGWKISNQHILEGLRNTKKITGLHGRWETIHDSPRVILDVAHNQDGIKEVVKQLELLDHNEIHIVFGMVKDKEIDTTLSLLPKLAHYYFTRAQIPRALPQDELCALAQNAGLKGTAYDSVAPALYAASQRAGKNDIILVCGSIFLVGEVSPAMISDIWKKDGYFPGGSELLLHSV